MHAVPPSAALTISGTALESACWTAAMIRGWPSVLPATLGAGKTGFATVPGGDTTRSGLKHPLFSGTSRAQSVCSTAVQPAAAVAT